MKTNKIITICFSLFALIAISFGITYGCLSFLKSKSINDNHIISKSQPDNTNVNWDDSSELNEWIKQNRKEDVWSGTGEENDPWLIQSEEDLAWLSYLNNKGKSGTYIFSNKFFMQTKDLDMSKYWWRPIATFSNPQKYFSGNYDGGGYVVKGIFTEKDAASFQGLFGNIFGRDGMNAKIIEIKNLGVEDSIINGTFYVGGLVGNIRNARIVNCHNSSTVNGSNYYVGGIAGRIYNDVDISYCYNTGSITGTSGITGGIAGMAPKNDNNDIYINNCYNTGVITAKSLVGGIIGRANDGVISNCYNTGTVLQTSTSSDDTFAGGIAGVLSPAEIRNCYNIGSISGSSSSYLGGIVALNYIGSKVENCFNIGEIHNGKYMGGVIVDCDDNSSFSNCFYGGYCTLNQGLYFGTDTTQKMAISNARDKSWVQANLGWDFDSTWTIVASQNDGYPVLKGFIKYPVDFDTTNYVMGDDGYIYGGNFGANFNVGKMHTDSGNQPILDLQCTGEGVGFYFGKTSNLTVGQKYKWSVDLKSTRNHTLEKVGQEQGGLRSVTVTTSWQTFTYEYIANDNNYNAFIFYGYDTNQYQVGEIISIKNFTLQSASGVVADNAIPSRYVTNASTYGKLPTPTRQGYAFEGWYTGKNGTGTRVTEETIFTSTSRQTLYSNWKPLDTEAPVIHRGTYVTREDGYDVYAYVTDNMGVNRVQFPTWTENNGQDDIQSSWDTNTAASGIKGNYTVDGQTYNYKYAVNMSDHNNEIGKYNTHIYAFDDVGNNICYTECGMINFARPWTDFAATSYAGGDGTASNPYQIETAQQLALLAKQSRTDSLEGKYFKQTAPIDLENKATKDSKYVWYMWEGIGDNDIHFKGYYDGSFYTINHMNARSTGRIGLFILIDGGKVSSVIIENSTIIGSDGIGAIVGHMDTGSIVEKCIVQNSYVSNNSTDPIKGHVGGIAGTDSGIEIRSCIVRDVEIKSEFGWEVGGITGSRYNGDIRDCSLFNVKTIGRERVGIINGFGGTSGTKSTYAYGIVTVNGIESSVKEMYGDSTSWRNWTYNSSTNNGYPIQKSLCWIGDVAPVDSSAIYNRLKVSLGFSEV